MVCSYAEQRLAAALIRFNLEPALYAHESWLPSWSRSATKYTLSRLSAELLQAQALASTFDWKMTVPASRFFMMDRAALGRVALMIGIASHRDRLRQIVVKSHLEVLRTALGDMLDVLWMPFAESQPRSPTRLAIRWDFFDATELKSDLANTGYRELIRLLNPAKPEQRAAALRAGFCVPRDLDISKADTVEEAQTLLSCNSIINEVIPHWAPAWTWLF